MTADPAMASPSEPKPMGLDTAALPLGERSLRLILDHVLAVGDEAETTYLEVKSSLDLSSNPVRCPRRGRPHTGVVRQNNPSPAEQGRRPQRHAMYQVVLARMASCQRTKDYVTKRTAEGKSKREIMRCLKRYAAREIYRQITNPQAAPNNSDLRQIRTALGCTITTAAREHGQWPSKISLLERNLLRDDTLATRYRQWLAEQSNKTPSNLIQVGVTA